MPNFDHVMSRRTVLRSLAGAALGQLVFTGAIASSTPPAAPAAPAAPARSFPPGAPGDFAFLAGEWRIQHQRLKKMGTEDWDVFEGEATCWSILGGVGSIEELRIPSRNFSGMGLRLLDVEKKLWSDYWVNAKSGVLGESGMPGGFENGVGTFLADDMDGDRPIVARGVWDQVTPTSCRWHQGVSYDGGKTWQENWWMEWKRA